MNSGWLLLEIELTPRIVIELDAPGTPELLVTSTPATRPCSELTKFSRCVWAISAPGTVCWATPMDRRTEVSPRAEMTVASSIMAMRFSWISIVLSAPTTRSTDSLPISRKIST